MTDNAVPVVGQYLVWTLPANRIGESGNYTFTWGWAWHREPRLIAKRHINRPGAMGSASFQLLRRTRQEPTDRAYRAYGDGLVVGQYVCITSADALEDDPARPGQKLSTLDESRVEWCGWINRLDYELAESQDDGMGTATALGLGHLLDGQQVSGWRREAADSGYAEAMGSPPIANMGDGTSYVIGNAVAVANLDGSEAGHAFARLPSSCSTSAANRWTRWRLLRHMILCCRSAALPRLTVVCADSSQAVDPSGTNNIAGYLNDTSVPEVFDLRSLTFKGALDLCAPRARLINWTLRPLKTGWQVLVYSMADAEDYGVPVNNAAFKGSANLEESPTARVNVTEDATDLPDEVYVEGGAHVVANTVGFPDQSLTVGWLKGNTEQEGLWKIAASGVSGYDDLTNDQKLERNAAVRSRPGLRDVFQKYGLYAYANGNVLVKSPGGDGTGAPAPLVPLVFWDGSTVTCHNLTAGQPCPYLPTATLLRTLPWPEGVESDGTDRRDATSKALPSFLKPKVFRYDSSDEQSQWIDLESRNGRQGFPSVSLDVEDRGAAVRLVLSDPAYLAKDHWEDTVEPAITDIGNPDDAFGTVNYEHLVLTIALESDQRLVVKRYRPGVTLDSQVRRRMYLRDGKLQLWCVPIGLLLGLKDDGTPDRVTAGAAFPSDANGLYVLTRNDYPTAQRRLDQAAAWAFRKRRAMVFNLGKPDTPPAWAKVGYMIDAIFGTDPDNGFVVGSCVEEVETDCQAGRLIVRTVLPPAPTFGGVSLSPDMGGTASLSLGGTLPQAIQSQQITQAATERDTQRLPVIIPRGGVASAPYLTVQIDRGNTLSNGDLGCVYVASGVATVPSAYDPNVTSSFIDGICRGTLFKNQVAQDGYVLVVLDNRGSFRNSLRQGDMVWVGDVVSIPVDVGGSVPAYPAG